MVTQYKPILFSTKMVQAILEGRKTQTRRLHGLDEIKKNPNDWTFYYFSKDDKRTFAHFRKQEDNKIKSIFGTSPYQIGDILWVRESFFNCSSFKEYPLFSEIKGNFCYKTNDFIGGHKWKPSIYMPKKAARIFLEVTNVRVERLKDISEEDAIAEGIDKKGDLYFNYVESEGYFKKSFPKEYFYKEIPKVSFISLWAKINGIDSWIANPWVWVYEFKQVHHPKGFLNEQ